jgi:hypothetical protein
MANNRERGRNLWGELHCRAINHDGSNDQKFINEFTAKIPRFMTGCPCNEFWNNWLRTHPINYEKGKYFEWTVECHNAVNKKLNKPTVGLNEAEQYWSSRTQNQKQETQNSCHHQCRCQNRMHSCSNAYRHL